MSEIKGPDLSSYQHPNGANPNFAAARKEGYAFVLIKASEGNGYRNPYFREDFANATKAGFRVGAYHFLRANVDAVAQANYFLETVRGYRLELPVAIDCETTDNESASMVHMRLDQFRTVLRQHGYRTMTYSYGPFLEAVIPAGCRFCASDPLWLAAYESTKPPAPRPWKEITLWQYTDHEVFGGVGADMSVYLGSDFPAFAGEPPAPPTKSGPKTIPAWYHRLLEWPISKLHDAGEVKFGMQAGADVAAVQRKLGVTADGLFGPNTEAHVKGFQKARKLLVDGIVGPDTARELGE